jgi:hypothetical protein
MTELPRENDPAAVASGDNRTRTEAGAADEGRRP